MARSKWKFSFFKKRILHYNFITLSSKIPQRFLIYERSSTIPYLLNNQVVYINKGLGWTKLLINNFHVSHKFGEFSLTKKPFYFPIREKTAVKLIKR